MDKTLFFSECREAFEDNSIKLIGGDAELEMYYKLAERLVMTNKVMNLTAITDMRGIIVRHIVDSLKLLDYVNDTDRTLLDVGCGGGFPILPCAIAASFRFKDLVLIGFDSTKKKVDHVNGCANELSLSNVSAVCGRAEELAANAKYRENFDVVTARAVSDQYILSELCLPFVKEGGRMVALKGAKGKSELEYSREHMQRLGGGDISLVEYSIKDREDEEYRCIIECKKQKKTDSIYPRMYSKIASEAKKVTGK